MTELLHTLAATAAFAGLVATSLYLRPAPPAQAGKLYVSNVLGGVQTRDLKSDRLIAETTTGLIPHALLLSADRSKLYVSNIGSQSITVLDAATGRRLKDLLVGEIPDNAAHRRLDPARLKQATTCLGCHPHTPVGTAPNAMAWAPDGQLMVTETKRRAVAFVDPESGATKRRLAFELPGRITPAHLLVHPHSREVWIFHRFEDFLRDGTARTHPVKSAPEGQHTSWVTVHSPDLTEERARFPMPWEVPSSTAFSPDGDRLYVSYRSSNRVAVFDPAARRMITSFETGVAPTGLAVSRDGRELYVACTFSNPAVLQVLDTTSGEIKVSLGIPPSPLMVAVEPASGHVFVTLSGTNQVVEIDPVAERLVRSYPAGHQPLDLALAP